MLKEGLEEVLAASATELGAALDVKEVNYISSEHRNHLYRLEKKAINIIIMIYAL